MLAGATKLYHQIAKDFETHAAEGAVATIEGLLKN
jgi:hypothetical protein